MGLDIVLAKSEIMSTEDVSESELSSSDISESESDVESVEPYDRDEVRASSLMSTSRPGCVPVELPVVCGWVLL